MRARVQTHRNRFGGTTDAIKAAGRGVAVEQGAQAGVGACAATPGLEELAPVCGVIGAKLAGIAYDQIVAGLEGLFAGGGCTGPLCTAPAPETVGGCGVGDGALVTLILAANPWLTEEPPLQAQPGVLSWLPICAPPASKYSGYCSPGAAYNPAIITYPRWWDVPIAGPAGTFGRAFLGIAKQACADAQSKANAAAWQQGAAQSYAAGDQAAAAKARNAALVKIGANAGWVLPTAAPQTSSESKAVVGAAIGGAVGAALGGGVGFWRSRKVKSKWTIGGAIGGAFGGAIAGAVIGGR